MRSIRYFIRLSPRNKKTRDVPQVKSVYSFGIFAQGAIAPCLDLHSAIGWESVPEVPNGARCAAEFLRHAFNRLNRRLTGEKELQHLLIFRGIGHAE